MDPLFHHLDTKVEPTGKPADRPSHPDSHTLPESRPCLPPARAPPHLPRMRPRSRLRPAHAVSPCIPVPRHTPSAAHARAFRACACGSAIFWDFAARSTIFAIMAQSFFDSVIHFWVLVHSLSVTQSFFRFLSVIFEILSRAQPFLLQWVSHFLDFVSHFLRCRPCDFSDSAIFWFRHATMLWVIHFFYLSTIIWWTYNVSVIF
jgi:hypothetical protein